MARTIMGYGCAAATSVNRHWNVIGTFSSRLSRIVAQTKHRFANLNQFLPLNTTPLYTLPHVGDVLVSMLRRLPCLRLVAVMIALAQPLSVSMLCLRYVGAVAP